MNRYKMLIGGLLISAIAIIVYTVLPQKMLSSSPKTKGSAKEAVQSSADAKKTAKLLASPKRNLREKTGADKQTSDESVDVSDGAKLSEKTKSEAKRAAAEKAVNAWEKLIDDLVASKEPSSAKQRAGVKEAFDQLDQGDQLDAIHRAVNLLPDSQFESLLGILYDKSENAEVLDIIFSDALNRSEDIKLPMMKELIKDNQHPMYFESARILDATGELDKMSGKTQTDADGTTETTTDN